MRVDQKTKEVTLTEIEYYELTNLHKSKSEVDFEDKFAKFLERKGAELGANPWSEEDLCELALYFYQNKNDDKQPEVDLEKEIEKWLGKIDYYELEGWASQAIDDVAHYFYELGLNARKEE